MKRMLIYTHLCKVLLTVATSVYGWALATVCSVVTFFAPERYAFYVVLVGVLLDAAFGIAVSLYNNSFVLSKLGRATIVKMAAYGSAMVLIFMIEKLAHDGGFIGVRVAAAWAAACEFWSLSASVLILWPNAPFFMLMRRHLKGEMSAKLGANIDDILPEKKA